MAKTRNKSNSLEAIREHYNSGGKKPLTEHQKVKWSRLRQVQALLQDFRNNIEIVKVLQIDYAVSEAQAYRDIQDAQKLYSTIRKADIEGLRMLAYDRALVAWRMAKKAGDVKGMNGAEANIIKIIGFDRESVEVPDFEKLEPATILTMLPAGIEKALMKMLEGGKIDFNQFPDIETVEYEPANDSTGPEGAEGENTATE